MAVFLAGLFLAAALVAVDFTVDLAGVLATDFLVVVALAGVAFFAGVFLAAVVLAVVLAGDFFAVVLTGDDFVAVDFLAVDFVAVDFLVVDFVAVDFVAADFVAADFVAAAVAIPAFLAVAFGTFLAPETYAFRSDPARNRGTAVALARLRSPVRGLRTIRADRGTRSNTPKPVIETF